MSAGSVAERKPSLSRCVSPSGAGGPVFPGHLASAALGPLLPLQRQRDSVLKSFWDSPAFLLPLEGSL